MKKKEIRQSHYYDGRRKLWKSANFIAPEYPTPDLVDGWIDKWEHTVGYPEQESALNKLFIEMCPKNEELDDILIKVCTLNDFYSTNIYKVIDVAKVIQGLKIDKRLKSDNLDTTIVDEIVSEVKKKTNRSVYSFATKYCSHHRPEIYPIYDSYVDLLLRYYRDNCKKPRNPVVFDFADKQLHNYDSFCQIEKRFVEYYGLKTFNAKQIDKFLWQEGKKCFPKWEIEQDS